MCRRLEQSSGRILVGKCCANCGHEFAGCMVLEDETCACDCQGGLSEIGVSLLGEEDYLGAGALISYPPGRFDSIQLRQSDIEKNDVWLKFRCFSDGFLAVAGCCHNLPVRANTQELARAAIPRLKIVDV